MVPYVSYVEDPSCPYEFNKVKKCPVHERSLTHVIIYFWFQMGLPNSKSYLPRSTGHWTHPVSQRPVFFLLLHHIILHCFVCGFPTKPNVFGVKGHILCLITCGMAEDTAFNQMPQTRPGWGDKISDWRVSLAHLLYCVAKSVSNTAASNCFLLCFWFTCYWCVWSIKWVVLIE